MKGLKKLYVAAFALLIAACTPAQSDEETREETMSYATKNGQVELTVARTEYYIQGSDKEIINLKAAEGNNCKYLTANSAILIQKTQTGNYPIRERFLKNKYPNLRIEPVLIPADRSARLLPTGTIKVKLVQGATMPAKVEENNYKVTSVAEEENTYLLSSTQPTRKILEFVTQLQQIKGIEFAEPNFIRNTNQYED